MAVLEINNNKFYALMKAEGLKIDPRSAQVTWQYAQVGDPYGVEDLPAEYSSVGRMYFARAPSSDTWVWFGDLPAVTRDALNDRLRAQRPPETVPFNLRLERMATAIAAIYDGVTFDGSDRGRALEAAQAALDVLKQFDASVSPDHSGESSGD